MSIKNNPINSPKRPHPSLRVTGGIVVSAVINAGWRSLYPPDRTFRRAFLFLFLPGITTRVCPLIICEEYTILH